jgi:predicted nucleic acid-binding protein
METQPIVTAPVMLDNTVLSNFALIGRSDLLWQLWGGELCTTQAVMREYIIGSDAGAVPPMAWDRLAQVILSDDEQQFAGALSLRLGQGERTCLAVAHLRNGLLVTDDRSARVQARRLGVAVTGTVGILVRLVRDEYLTLAAADELLGAMITAGFRSPVPRLDDALPNDGGR